MQAYSADGLPEGWDWTTISDIVGKKGIFVDGDWVESRDQDPNGDVRLIQLADIGDGEYRNKSERFLKYEKAIELCCTFLKKGDVLIARMPDPLGRSCIFPGDLKKSVTVVDVAIVRPGNADFETKCLMYFINAPAFRNAVASLESGTTRKRISRSNLATMSFPLPPLPEQHAIVSRIEQLFSELDKGIEALKTAQQQLKVYRQSVLKWAFEGKLTEKWRQNQDLPDAQDLLEKIQKEREEKAMASGMKLKQVAPLTKDELDALPELPEGWGCVRSGELYGFVTSGSRGWAKYYSAEGAIFLRITNLDFDSLELDLSPENIQYVKPPQGTEGQRTRIFEGDFLFSITGYLGMFAIAPKLDEAYVNQHIALCRPIEGFDKKYFGYWVISRVGGNHFINQLQKGATKAGLGLDDIQNFPVPICSLPEQSQIVQEIESRLSECDNMEATIATSLQQAEALRQSILKKAFEGRLLNDKELEAVRQDPAWEPAERLLERIREENAGLHSEKKGRKSKA